MGLIKYFFDSYAIIELIKGNSNYARYVSEEVVITIFNLAEIYWAALNELNEKEAEEIYNQYKLNVIDIDDDILKEAIKFRKINKKKDLSYTDCIGYIYALRKNLKFLTGDKEFEEMDNVEFVK
ncbi:MAG: PIN domain-containing protein [Nanoarchaeota archaeon]